MHWCHDLGAECTHVVFLASVLFTQMCWCVQVADGSMQCVSAVPSLQSLVLGGTRVTDVGLVMLTGLPALTHMALSAESVTQTGLLVGARNCPTSCCSLVAASA